MQRRRWSPFFCQHLRLKPRILMSFQIQTQMVMFKLRSNPANSYKTGKKSFVCPYTMRNKKRNNQYTLDNPVSHPQAVNNGDLRANTWCQLPSSVASKHHERDRWCCVAPTHAFRSAESEHFATKVGQADGQFSGNLTRILSRVAPCLAFWDHKVFDEKFFCQWESLVDKSCPKFQGVGSINMSVSFSRRVLKKMKKVCHSKRSFM